MKPPVLWFYGLSGSGKTTLANYAYFVLATKYYPVVFLDADKLRNEYWPELGLSRDSRIENTRRIVKLAKSYYSLDCAIVVAASAPFQQQREEALQTFPQIKFISVNTPLHICVLRKPHVYGVDNENKVTLIDRLPLPWAEINCDQDIKESLTNLASVLEKV